MGGKGKLKLVKHRIRGWFGKSGKRDNEADTEGQRAGDNPSSSSINEDGNGVCLVPEQASPVPRRQAPQQVQQLQDEQVQRLQAEQASPVPAGQASQQVPQLQDEQANPILVEQESQQPEGGESQLALVEHGSQQPQDGGPGPDSAAEGERLPTPSDTTINFSYTTQKLWSQAYKKIKEDAKYSQLLEKCEEILQRHPGPTAADKTETPEHVGAADKLERIQSIAQEMLDNLSHRESLTICGRELITRTEARKLIKIMSDCKDIIGLAIESEPHAALAWTIVMAGIPLVDKVFQQDENATGGFEKITFLLIRFRLMENEFLSPSSWDPNEPKYRQLAQAVEGKLVDIYSSVYRYQIRFVLQYTRSARRQFIRNLGGIDDWVGMLQAIETGGEEIDKAIENMANGRIRDRLQTVDKRLEDLREGQKLIEDAVRALHESVLQLGLQYSGSAAFDSLETSKEGKCLPGTQRDTLSKIRTWVEDADAKPMLWLRGMAGTGKTSIARTVAESLNEGDFLTESLNEGDLLAKNTYLGASFFMKLGHDPRSKVGMLLPTIAKFLAERNPQLGQHISNAMKGNATIGDKRLQEQMKTLILGPLSKLNRDLPWPIRLVIIIDALDECDDSDRVEEVLRHFQSLWDLKHVIVRIMITSRPEVHIQRELRKHEKFVHQLVLDKVPQPTPDLPLDDITLLMKHDLAQIISDPNLRPDWISDDQIKKLVQKADGLFIYAATICRFLGAPKIPGQIRIKRLLNVIEGKTGLHTPEDNLAEIYLKVLDFSTDQLADAEEKKEVCRTYRTILGSIALVFEQVSVTTLSSLIKKDSIADDLIQLHAIVDVPKNDGSLIGFFHLSFRDYLTSKRASLDFRIDERETHQLLFKNCLDIMEQDLHEDMCNLQLPGSLVSEMREGQRDQHISQHLRYSCLHWVGHLSKLDSDQQALLGLQDGGAIHNFLLGKFLYWLETLSLLKEMPRSIHLVRGLQRMVDDLQLKTTSGLSDLLRDSFRFLLNNRRMIEEAPLQTYCSALVFSPMKSVIREKFLTRHKPSWISRLPVVEDRWSPVFLALEGHTNDIWSIAMSRDGTMIVSGSLDNTTRVWDTLTGAEILKFEETTHVSAVAFCKDNKTVASGLWDGLIKIREIGKNEEITLRGHSTEVRHLSFSPTKANILASTAGDSTLRLWNVKAKEALFAVNFTEEYTWPHAFSPDGLTVAVGCGDDKAGVVVFVNVETKEKKRMVEHRKAVFAVAFSLDGKKAASGSWDGTLKVWHTGTGETECQFNLGRSIGSIAFSPTDQQLIAIGQEGGRVTLHSTATKPQAATLVKAFPTYGSSGPSAELAFSPSDDLLASTASDRIIRLWETVMDTTENTNELIGTLEVQFFPWDENTVSSTSWEGARLWDVNTGTEKPMHDDIRHVKLLPKSKLVAMETWNKDVQIWNSDLTEMVRAFSYVSKVKFSPDGEMVALWDNDEVRVLDTSTGTWSETAPLKVSGARSFTISPTNEVVGWTLQEPKHRSGSPDDSDDSDDLVSYTLRLYNLKTNAFLVEERCGINTGGIYFSPDGRLAVIPGEGLLLEIATGKRVSLPSSQEFASVAFNSGTSQVAIGHKGGYIDVWDSTEREVHRLRVDVVSGLDLYPRGLDFSSNGKLAAAYETKDWERGHESWIIQVWDSANGENPRVLQVDAEMSYRSFSFSFSDDGTHLVSGNGRFPLPPQNLASVSERLPEESQDCLYVGRQWIVQGFGNLLWLPPAYRVPARAVAVHGETVVLGHGSGLVTVFKFDLANTPLVRKAGG